MTQLPRKQKKTRVVTRKGSDEQPLRKHKSEGASTKRKLRTVHIGQGVPSIPEMNNELIDMTNVLLGRTDAPMIGVMGLMEVADVYYARAAEMTMLLQAAEREGTVIRGSSHYKFRTGELRTFLEMAKKATELGSRRVTYEQMRQEAELNGRDSRSM